MQNNHRLAEIEQRIRKQLNPSYLEIIDDSAEHHGHAGAASGAGHFTIIISSTQFNDKSLVACHRMVYDAVGDLMHSEIHALRIQVKRE